MDRHPTVYAGANSNEALDVTIRSESLDLSTVATCVLRVSVRGNASTTDWATTITRQSTVELTARHTFATSDVSSGPYEYNVIPYLGVTGVADTYRAAPFVLVVQALEAT